MREHSARQPLPPADWATAFAALPLDAPDADAWQVLAARLPSPSRARWPLLLATAATFALVALASLRLLTPAQDAPVAAIAPVASKQGTEGDSTALATRPVEAARPSSTESATPQADASPLQGESPASTDAKQQYAAADTTRVEPSPATHSPMHAPRDSAPSTPASAAQVATIETDAPPLAATLDPRDQELGRLYAESAQLEGLISLARDDRLASGTAASLAGALDAQVASIDAALIQPGIDATRRNTLWQDRVAALRQLASFESTQRLLASRGEQYDAMLVSID